ncbi:MAG: transcription antitermination factor NusB, partial [Beijerinckiaceae bacterium]
MMTTPQLPERMDAASAPAPRSPRADGLAARRFALVIIADVTRRRLPLDEQLEKLARDPTYMALSPGDRGMTRAVATAALRRLGLIRKTLADRMERGMPPKSGNLEAVLIAGTAQILVLGTPAHAAVDTSVELVREDGHGRHFADLANAVLRRIAAEKDTILSDSDPLVSETPGWLAERWTRFYGEERAAAIAAAHLAEPGIDLTVKGLEEGLA